MATIKDVAKHAGVSIATVSRIINNRGPISEKTRKKVYASMKALQYQPNEMARALQKKKSNIIGLIVPSIQYSFFGKLIEAVESVCQQNGYKLMLCRTGENESREIEMVAMLEANKVDGIIVCSRLGDTAIYTGKMSMPIVSIDREIQGLSVVTSDNYAGGVLAAEELYAAGCSNPALFGDKTPEYMAMHGRNIGFFDRCKSLGVTAHYFPASCDAEDKAEVERLFLQGLKAYPQTDGIFITGDALAASLFCGTKIKQKKIFDKFPILSYDGLEFSELLDITSVAQPVYEMGAAAAVQLVKEIEQCERPRRMILPVRLIRRKSTQSDKKGGKIRNMDFKELTEYIDSLYKKYGIPAADCKITKGHKTIYRYMTGYADYEKTSKINEDTIYRLFSATKVVTMTAVMQQIEQGKIELYDEVRKYLPEFGQMKVADQFEFGFPVKWPTSDEPCHYAHHAIRIIDLMTMTGGLSYDLNAKEIQETCRESENKATTREVMKAIAKMPLAYEPGTRFCYSLCHDVLAAVVEVVSGERYGDYVKKHIFEPLGIQDFYFHFDKDEQTASRICALYKGVFGTDDIVPDDGSLSDGFKITENYESGGAGLAGTVDAYSAFIEALCNGGVGANGARILSEESVRMFTVPYTTGQMSKDFAATGKKGYEYGLGVRVLTDERYAKSPVGEFGWDGAAGAYVLIDPVNHISIFYTQHVVGFPKVYSEIHPQIRDIAYRCMGY